MSELTLTNIFSQSELQQIQSLSSKATGLATYIMDLNGPVTQISNPSSLFSEVILKSNTATQYLHDWESNAIQQSFHSSHPATVVCDCGFACVSVPFIYNSKPIGALIMGQVFLEKPDESKISGFIENMKLDSNKCMSLAKTVNIIPRQKVHDIADMMFGFINMFIEKLSKNDTSYVASTGEGLNPLMLKRHIKDAEALLASNEKSVKALAEKFTELNALS